MKTEWIIFGGIISAVVAHIIGNLLLGNMTVFVALFLVIFIIGGRLFRLFDERTEQKHLNTQQKMVLTEQEEWQQGFDVLTELSLEPVKMNGKSLTHD